MAAKKTDLRALGFTTQEAIAIIRQARFKGQDPIAVGRRMKARQTKMRPGLDATKGLKRPRPKFRAGRQRKIRGG